MRRLFMIPEERRLRDTELQRAILRELIELRKDIKRMQAQIDQAFTDLNEKVANIESAEQAAEMLLQTLNEQLQAALNSSSDPTEVVNAIRAVSDRLNTDASALAAAVTANTPAAPASGGGTDTGTGGTDTGTGGTDTGSGDATDPTA